MRIAALSLVLAMSLGSVAAATCGGSETAKTLPDWVRLGDCLRENGDAQSAISAYQRGLTVSPAGSRDVFLGLAQAYDDRGDWQHQMEAVQAALHIDPADPETLYWLGITFEVAKNWEPALENFRKVVAIRPDDNRAHRNIGFVLLQTDQPEAAIDPLEKAVAVAPNDWKAHANLASAYRKTPKAIAAELRTIGADGHVVTPHETELRNKLKTIDYLGKSIEHARRAAELRPEDSMVWNALGWALQDAKKYKEAIDAFKHADSIAPDNYGVLSALALAQKEDGQSQEALETCQRIESRGGKDRWLQLTMGDLNVRLQHDEAAERHYRAAIRLDSKDWMARVALAKALKRMNRMPEAEQEIAAAKAANPGMVQVIDGYYGNR